MTYTYTQILRGDFKDAPEQRSAAGLSAIFGSGVRLVTEGGERTQRLVAVYPCDTETLDDLQPAAGLMCVLGWMLGAVEGIKALPVLVRDPTEPEASDAFSVEEFQLDNLGEDTLVTGRLTREVAVLKLALSVEAEDSDEATDAVTISGAGWGELFSRMGEAFDGVAKALNESITLPPIAMASLSEADAREFLVTAFQWHKAMLRDAVAGGVHALGLHTELAQAARRLSIPTISWLTLCGTALTASWVENIDAEQLIEYARGLPHWEVGVAPLAQLIAMHGDITSALELLESAVESTGAEINWLVLGRLYAALNRPDLAVEVLQRGIEAFPESVAILQQYAVVLLALAEESVNISSYVLLNSDDERATQIGEAVAALDKAIHLTKGAEQAALRVQLIAAQSRFGAGQVWDTFSNLAQDDHTGTYTEVALGTVSALEDIESALPALEAAVNRYPNKGRVWRNFAYVQYLIGEGEQAVNLAEKALTHAEDQQARGEYQLIKLFAENEGLETRLAELADVINAGSDLSDRDLEYLEWVVGEVPLYGEGYLLLAKAYEAIGEANTALEVLLDAESQLEAVDPAIVSTIVDLLMDSDEDTVALEYITKGLEAYPRHVPLLARAALVTYHLGDDDSARAFLRQAHGVSPYHPDLMRVANELSEADDD